MRTLAEHRHLFMYDDWANKAVIESIKALPNGRARALQLLSHVVETEILWHRRILQDYRHISGVWNDWPLNRCAKEQDDMHALWVSWIERSAESLLSERISYVNTKGTTYVNSVEEILTHVINHSTYHRAQIAAEVRKAGGEPAYTDYIQYCRQL